MWGCELEEARRRLMRNRVKTREAGVLGHLSRPPGTALASEAPSSFPLVCT